MGLREAGPIPSQVTYDLSSGFFGWNLSLDLTKSFRVLEFAFSIEFRPAGYFTPPNATIPRLYRMMMRMMIDYRF